MTRRPLSPFARPDDWSSALLGDFSEPQRGLTYSAATLSDHDGVPYINLKSFGKGGGLRIDGTKRYIGPYKATDLLTSRHLLLANTDLTPTGDVIGAPALLPPQLSGIEVLSSHHVSRIELPSSVNPQFVAAVLALPVVRNLMRSIAAGTTVLNLSGAFLKRIEIALPPLAEQRRIAEALDTLDEVLRKTQQLIVKLKQVKRVLLHDLLTRGIDDNGELRDPARHPEQFKDSQIGRIPASWSVVGLEQLAENHDGKRVPLKQSDRSRRHGAYPYYGASGIIDWIDDYLFDGEFVLLGEDGENVVSRQVPLAFVASGRFWVNNHAHIYAPRAGVDTRFFAELLESTDYSRFISGSAQPKLTQAALGRLRFAIPPGAEQKQISDILSAHDTRAASEVEHLEKLCLLKQGLMEDLLTGRVRVTSLLDEAAT